MRLQLNFNKPDNYAFFCPVSRLHLTRSNPTGTVSEVTSYISRGLKSKVILDVTESTGQKASVSEPKNPGPTPKQEDSTLSVEDVSEQVQEQSTEKTKEETPQEEKTPAPRKRGRKSTKL